jgi:intergrase/recombinase
VRIYTDLTIIQSRTFYSIIDSLIPSSAGTKAAYISVVGKDIIGIAQSIEKTPTLNALKMVTRHRCLSMQIKYCRKIYASYLHKCGMSSDLIDMLQGRIGKNIFLKHYLTLTGDYNDRVLDALKKLKHEIDLL